MGGLLGFLYRQVTFTPKPLPTSTALSGKTALITGANSGLGLEAARELASHDLSRLILAVRDVSKGEAAKTSILESTKTKCEIEVWPLDHEDYDSIKEFGKRVKETKEIDYALLNAGIKKLGYEASPKTGHELNLQVNHIGTSAVSLLILPTLQKTARETKRATHLTLVSSEGHFWIPFKEQSAPNILARMDEKSSFGTAQQRYYTTKLLNVLWARELASKVEKSEVVVNTVNPGFCYSGLHRHQNRIINVALGAYGWTSAQGGHCLIDALVGKNDSHGEYLSDQRVTPPSAFVLSDEGKKAQTRIWDETITLLKKEAPNIDVSIQQ